jgi:protein SSD1
MLYYYFQGSIKRWPITSLHPFGTLEKQLGSVFETSTQTKAIYADNNVTDTDFSDAIYKCLPPKDFEASLESPTVGASKRRDFSQVRCFTIDPIGSNGK